jgi:glutathione S-transferase
MHLIIGNKNYSSWSLRPWLLLKLFNLPFNETKLPLFTEAYYQEIDQYSPNGKVPVLHDDDVVIWDSLAICEYINETYCDNAAWPRDAKKRAYARAISAEMHSGFPNIRGAMPMDCRRAPAPIEMSPALKKEVQRVDQIWTECRKAHQVGGPWLMGDLSIADVMFAPVAIRFDRFAVTDLSQQSQDYVQFLLSQVPMQEWIANGKAETEVIDF